jgi:hypothetical protein
MPTRKTVRSAEAVMIVVVVAAALVIVAAVADLRRAVMAPAVARLPAGDGPGGFRPRGEGGPPRRDGDDRRGPPRRFGDRDRGAPPQREWVEIPKDVQITIFPEDKAVDALAAHVRQTGHAFSMFDAARLVLAGGDRFMVRFRCAEERPRALSCACGRQPLPHA